MFILTQPLLWDQQRWTKMMWFWNGEEKQAPWPLRTYKIRRHLKTHNNRHTHIRPNSAITRQSSCSRAPAEERRGTSAARRRLTAALSAGEGPQRTQEHEWDGGSYSDTLTPYSRCAATNGDVMAQAAAWRWQDSTRDLVSKNWDTSFHLRGCPHGWVIRGRVRWRGQRASAQETGNIQYD